ncbi:MAG: hypothetical protein JNM70_04830, partial [Anaerolineae bacterium]|nr:hypothetical protein [Anaerolineae bacterium]
MSPTIHHGALPFFSANPNLEQLVNCLFHDFEITWASTEKNFNTMLYAFILKPRPHIREAFGFEREVLCVYSPYRTLEPRSLQIAEYLISERISVRERVEPILYILISDDVDIEDKLKSLVVDSRTERVIIPFFPQELLVVRQLNNKWDVKRVLQPPAHVTIATLCHSAHDS